MKTVLNPPSSLDFFNIILIEDNPDDADLVEDFLFDRKATQPISLTKFEQLSQGILALNQKKFDLIILDLSLPDSCGLNTLSRVTEYSQRIPLVVLTANADEEVALKAIQMGAQDYLIKGRFDRSLFNRALHYAVARKKSQITEWQSQANTLTDLVELKQVTLALQKSQERLQFAVEGSNLGLWDWNIVTGETYFDARWKKILGYEEHEIENCYQSWETLVHPEDLSRVLVALNACLQGEASLYKTEYRMRSKEGSWIWILDLGKVCERDNIGNPLRMTGTHQNISEKKLAEAELLQFRFVVESTSDAVGISDINGRHFYQNQAFTELYEYPTAADFDAAGGPISVFTNTEVAIDLLSTIQAGHCWIGEVEQVSRTGRKFSVLLRANPLRDKQAEIVGFAAIITDISNRKKTEEALKQAFLEAEQSKNLLRTIIDTTPDLIFAKDCSFRYILVNQNFAHILGKSSTEILGLDDLELGVPPEKIFGNPTNGIPGIRETDQAVLNGHITHNTYDDLILADGTVHIFDTKKLPLRNERGEIVAILGVAHEITEIKSKEEALQKSQSQLKEAQRIAHIGNWDFDVNTGEIQWSDELYQVWGRDPGHTPTFEEVIQQIYLEDRLMFLEAVEKAMTDGIPYEFDHRIYRLNGEIRYINAKGEAVKNEAGQVIKLFGTSMDITDRKQVEIALREREQFLRTIYEGIEAAVFILDVRENGEFCYAGLNGIHEQISGITAAQIEGKTPQELLGDEAAKPVLERYQACVTTGKKLAYEERVMFGEQETWWITNLTPIKDQHNRVSRIIGTSFNITQRKAAEVALVQVKAAVESASDAIAIADLNGRVLYHNPAFIHRYGYTPEDLNNSEGPMIMYGSVEVATEVFQTILQGNSWSGEVELKTREGEIVPNNWLRANCIYNEAGEALGLIGVHTDITERKIIEGALRESEARERAKSAELEALLHKLKSTQTQLVQQEKMAGLGQLVAGVAHEINNPTSFIYGNINFAKQYTQNLLEIIDLYQKYYPEPAQEITETLAAFEIEFLKEDLTKLLISMQEGASRITEIVQSLRNFSRLDEAEKKEADIHAGLDSTLMILQHRLKEQPHRKAIQVIKEFGALPLVECYPGQLNQVFMNLLSNALDALEENCKKIPNFIPKIWIQTEVRRREKSQGKSGRSSETKQSVLIRILDNGPGIPLEIQERIFNPFFTTKPVGAGTGLGLSISYQIIVERHQGKLKFNSQPNQGTEFIIEIPLNAK